MKRLFAIILTLLLCTTFSLPACAEISEADLEALEDEGIITEGEADGSEKINLWDKLLKALGNGLTLGAAEALKTIGLLTAVLVLSSMLHAADGLSHSGALKSVYSLISVLGVMTVAYPVCTGVFGYVAACFDALSKAMVTITSATTTLYALGGNTAVASVSATNMFLLGTVIDVLASQALMPFLSAAFALAAAGALPGTVNLSPVSTFVRNTVTTVTAFAFTLFAFMNYLQTAVASSADSYAYRTAKFASGVFIPVIGNMLGDAARTVSGSIAVIKSVVGSAGIAAVFLLLVPPCVCVLCCRLALLVSGIIARVLGCERESRFLYDIGGVVGILFAITVGVAAVLLISLAMFIKMEVTV